MKNGTCWAPRWPSAESSHGCGAAIKVRVLTQIVALHTATVAVRAPDGVANCSDPAAMRHLLAVNVKPSSIQPVAPPIIIFPVSRCAPAGPRLACAIAASSAGLVRLVVDASLWISRFGGAGDQAFCWSGRKPHGVREAQSRS